MVVFISAYIILGSYSPALLESLHHIFVFDTMTFTKAQPLSFLMTQKRKSRSYFCFGLDLFHIKLYPVLVTFLITKQFSYHCADCGLFPTVFFVIRLWFNLIATDFTLAPGWGHFDFEQRALQCVAEMDVKYRRFSLRIFTATFIEERNLYLL